MPTENDTILYRAHRLRFIICALFLLPLTVGMGALVFVHADAHDRGGFLMPILAALFLWLDFVVVVKLIWPPEIEISTSGIRLSNRALFVDGAYSWNEIDGPVQSSGSGGVPILDMKVIANDKKIRMPPSHFGATYEEMAEVISSARSGRLIAPLQWRTDHPQKKLYQWLKNWGLPLLVGGGIAIVLAVLKR